MIEEASSCFSLRGLFMEDRMKRRIQKPIGVYVICIAIFIVHGVLQLLTYLLNFQLLDGGLPFIVVFISLFFCAFTAFSAVWASIGDNSARIALLAFDSLGVLWWLFLVIVMVANSESNNFAVLSYIFTLVRPLIVLGLCWWYFTKKEVVEYYKQESEVNKMTIN